MCCTVLCNKGIFTSAGIYLEKCNPPSPTQVLQNNHLNLRHETKFSYENTKHAKQSLKHILKLIESTRIL